MDSKYDHKLYEQKINEAWAVAGVNTPSDQPAAGRLKPGYFSLVLPPPNANDPLHVGHAMYTIEDILVRFHRMRGDDTLWLPGADHAGIETQFVFEKKLQKAGKSRFQFDRDTLYQMVWDYVQENKQVARQQLERLGFSLDWSRFKYTLDSDVVARVLQTFQHLHREKLVYRDMQLVNYCTKCGTAFSDLEVKHKTARTPLYYIKYGPFVLATTRPETKFGDTAVAVHPDDERYARYIGQTITVQGVNGPFQVKVIADEYVEREFGTGVVKITPYHDHNDFAVWQRHKDELPSPIQVIDFQGKMTTTAGPYAGMSVAAAREAIVAKMQEMGLIDHIDDKYENQLSCCYRCGRTLEPLPKAQFFIKTKPLAAPIIEKLDAGEITVYGTGYDKILRNWLTNLRDWNISRQIVWGIRQPVWYKVDENSEIQVSFLLDKKDKKADIDQVLSKEIADGRFLITGLLKDILPVYDLKLVKKGLQSVDAPIDCAFVIELEKTDLDGYIQETDTFDTWFSSAQWPFVTLMTNKPGDFERFYPTSVLETGYDILPFWVMRMLMMGQFETGKLPFSRVYLHGLVRDSKGQKMSKSKGNVINPLEVADKYGADALRFALVVRSSAGQDKSIGEQDFKAARNLTNKLWNAARFSQMLTDEQKDSAGSQKVNEEFSRQIKQIVTDVSEAFGKLQTGAGG
ncbi:class I tRNA ligase family protein [bacterium]|nr:class I tRNA ligase family protein [bacterium]